jgi:hypothetical protein
MADRLQPRDLPLELPRSRPQLRPVEGIEAEQHGERAEIGEPDAQPERAAARFVPLATERLSPEVDLEEHASGCPQCEPVRLRILRAARMRVQA